jgi:hypothetical protein
MTDRESSHLLDEFLHIIAENHDLQVRFRWSNKNDVGESPFQQESEKRS